MSGEDFNFDDIEVGVNIDEILPGLYLGDYYSSQRIKALKKRNIKVLINCTPDLKEKFDGIEYHHFHLYDWISQDIRFALKDTFKIIKNALDSNKNVYIHCHEGISRSASMVIFYVMRTMKKSFSEANDFVVKKRNEVAPNIGFIKQIKEVDEQLRENEKIRKK